MDVKAYYQKIREVENQLPAGDVVIVSLDTPDGGRAGRAMEAGRRLAAKMMVDGRARVATPEEAEVFRKSEGAAQAELLARMSPPHMSFSLAKTEDRNGTV
jgi:hypothetical protein